MISDTFPGGYSRSLHLLYCRPGGSSNVTKSSEFNSTRQWFIFPIFYHNAGEQKYQFEMHVLYYFPENLILKISRRKHCGYCIINATETQTRNWIWNANEPQPLGWGGRWRSTAKLHWLNDMSIVKDICYIPNMHIYIPISCWCDTQLQLLWFAPSQADFKCFFCVFFGRARYVNRVTVTFEIINWHFRFCVSVWR